MISGIKFPACMMLLFLSITQAGSSRAQRMERKNRKYNKRSFWNNTNQLIREHPYYFLEYYSGYIFIVSVFNPNKR
jgi:3-methyladenine DNA glycosylase AlkC